MAVDTGQLNMQALLDALSRSGTAPQAHPAVQQPGMVAPGGYDAPVRIEAAQPAQPTNTPMMPVDKPMVKGAAPLKAPPKMKPAPTFGGL